MPVCRNLQGEYQGAFGHLPNSKCAAADPQDTPSLQDGGGERRMFVSKLLKKWIRDGCFVRVHCWRALNLRGAYRHVFVVAQLVYFGFLSIVYLPRTISYNAPPGMFRNVQRNLTSLAHSLCAVFDQSSWIRRILRPRPLTSTISFSRAVSCAMANRSTSPARPKLGTERQTR